LYGYPPIALPLGRCVGGTTVINSGTCFRTPEYVLNKWEREYNLKDISPENLDPFFKKVEEVISVKKSPMDVLGKNNILIKQGADSLGWKGGVIPRNITDCKGCGRCALGCPEDAKRAMHITYVPLALKYGARFYTYARAEKIIRRGDGFCIKGIVSENGKKKDITIYSKIVGIAGGTIFSPQILKNSGIGKESAFLGKNLHIHPAVRVCAVFDEEIRGWEGVPQGYYIDEFLGSDGIILEGVFLPPDMFSISLPYIGKKYKDLMMKYKNISAFGAMVSDTSTGFIKTLGRETFIFYNLNKYDTERLKKAVSKIAEIYFTVGAKRVFTGIYGWTELKDMDENKRFLNSKIKPTQIESMAFHPLGTCRMGSNPYSSVVDSYCKVHSVKNLFVVDGSIFPSSLGVNPQLSIMAFATRAAHYLLG